MDDEGAVLVEVVENCAAVKLPRLKLGSPACRPDDHYDDGDGDESNGSAVQISRTGWPLLVMIIMITTSK